MNEKLNAYKKPAATKYWWVAGNRHVMLPCSCHEGELTAVAFVMSLLVMQSHQDGRHDNTVPHIDIIVHMHFACYSVLCSSPAESDALK